ncbi:MAG: extracellular solute-binding protein [Lachnospiraceae bacterium]
MKKKTKKRLQNTGLVVVLVAIVLIIFLVNKSQNQSDAALRAEILSGEYDFSVESEYISYAKYLEALGDKVQGNEDGAVVEISADQYKDSTLNKLEDLGDGNILTGASGEISYEVEIPVSGMYQIEIGYYPSADNDKTILRDLKINGEVPYEQAYALDFPRMWNDTNKNFLMKTDGNQATPQQGQTPDWGSYILQSADYSVEGPLLFYFEKGSNILSLVSEQCSMGISYIKLTQTNGLISYEKYLADAKANGAAVVNASEIADGAVMVQAEDTYVKSSAMLTPQNDRTSEKTIPYHASNIIMNTIGDSSWSDDGQAITWELNVPKSGLYKIAMRFSQSSNRDFYSARELKINGAIPFKEAADVKFYYESNFQLDYLGNEDGAYYFYLEEGSNYLTLTVTQGDLAYAIEQTGISVSNFNTLYRKITAVTGSSPDQYRDYGITTSVPDMVDIMKTEYARLTSVMESLGDSLASSTKTTEVAQMLIQLEKLIKKPDSIATELSNFNDNITAVSNWYLALSDQPLTLDYILVCGEGYKLGKANGNFFTGLLHNVKQFVGSFTNDYTVVMEGAGEKDSSIVVWIATSTRDQYDVVNSMINNAFADSNINVELKMVGADTVMPATLTGNGPDVAIQLNYSMPTNFAYREAGYDLTQFDDFDEVAAQFSEGAMEYFEYQGGYYALPDQMTFPVLFYRTDIFDEMGWEVPETWDELKTLLPYLQAENMACFFESTGYITLGGYSSTATIPVANVFASMLYQNDIDLYRADGAETNLDTIDAQLVFKDWTEYYTKYAFDLSVSIVTRFRTGEIPLMVVDYTYINSIAAAAPEIAGKWAIAAIPGTEKADGSIDHTAQCMVSSSMIIRQTVEEKGTQDEAWEFLKWWTSAATQQEYNEQLKVVEGDSAELPLANLEAVMAIAETNGRADAMATIIESLRGTPQVPGGYITGRCLQNAFLSVVDDYVDPVDTIYAQIRFIDQELKTKREEFGLSK